MRLLGDVSIAPVAVFNPCLGCPSTHVFFYEALATGMISIVGRRPFGAHERYDAFALGVQVDAVERPAAACVGGFVGIESNGSTLTVERNALVEVRLEASPASTGFSWVVDPATPAAAEIVLPCRSPAENGCPQTFVFFRAVREGQLAALVVLAVRAAQSLLSTNFIVRHRRTRLFLRPCPGCPSTHVFFYEALATGMIRIVGKLPFGVLERYDAFALGVQVEAVERPAAACVGGFVGIEYNDSTLTVKRNALVEVRLEASPASTGFSWVVDPATPAAAEIVLPCRSPAENGCPQTFVFFFRAAREGQVRVNLIRIGRETEAESVFALNIQFSRYAPA
eukprot:m51a1_g6067 hypothetical protein (338) ;mRNA; r:266056-268991